MNSLINPEPISPDPPPFDRRAVLRQRWDELAYFHWPYPVDEVQRLLPPGLRVDTFDGSAWVGLIPFHMRRVQIGPTPPVPYLGDFVEINVRTYVVDVLGRRLVWFFSLDVPRTAIVGVARSAFALPYCFGPSSHERNGSTHIYTTRRAWPRSGDGSHHRPMCRLEFDVGEPLADGEVGELEYFLTARWGLVTARSSGKGDRLLHGAVDHPRWPLHRINQHSISQTLVEAAGLATPHGEPHAMYSPGVDVRVGWLQPVPTRSPTSSNPTIHIPQEMT